MKEVYVMLNVGGFPEAVCDSTDELVKCASSYLLHLMEQDPVFDVWTTVRCGMYKLNKPLRFIPIGFYSIMKGLRSLDGDDEIIIFDEDDDCE